ncbi:unnamed protein product [Prorocentrum cordatum]|uniref:Exocyst complex component Sec6 n=1 Tax=Prorocentrum cordatum TaxID=2364126 RepID=A0ABN9U675_9DINO|nr:unnamed protein product [Polarella glacialis]
MECILAGSLNLVVSCPHLPSSLEQKIEFELPTTVLVIGAKPGPVDNQQGVAQEATGEAAREHQGTIAPRGDDDVAAEEPFEYSHSDYCCQIDSCARVDAFIAGRIPPPPTPPAVVEQDAPVIEAVGKCPTELAAVNQPGAAPQRREEPPLSPVARLCEQSTAGAAADASEGWRISSGVSVASGVSALTLAAPVGSSRAHKRGAQQRLQDVATRQAKAARQAHTVCGIHGCNKRLNASDKRSAVILCGDHLRTYTLGYMYLNDETVCQMTESDHAFRSCFETAHQERTQNQIKPPKCRTDRRAGFWTRSDIWEKLGYMPEQLSHKSQKLWNEKGEEVWAVLTDETEGAPRVFVLSCSKAVQKQETKSSASATIHADQPAKVYEHSVGSLRSEWAPSGAPIISMKALVERAVKKRDADKRKGIPVDDDDGAMKVLRARLRIAMIRAETLPQHCLRLRLRPALLLRVGDADGLAADVAELAQADPVKATWQLQIAKVSHSQALMGSALGRQRSTLKGYAAEADSMGRSEGAPMRERVELTAKAEALASENGWFSLPRSELCEILQSLKYKGVDVPTKAKNDCTARALQDWSQSTDGLEEKVAELIDIVQAWPQSSDGENTSDPLKPRLRHIEGSPKDSMTSMYDNLLRKVVIPLIKDGAKGFDAVVRVIKTVIGLVTVASDDENLNFEPCEDAADEMCSMLRGIAMIIQPDVAEQRKILATNRDFDRVQSISANMRVGDINTIATMKQNSHYKGMLAGYIRCRPHYEDIMPRLLDVEKKLSVFGSAGNFQEKFGILKLGWQVTLDAEGKARAAQMQHVSHSLEACTLDVLKKVADEIEEQVFDEADATGLKELIDTCETVKLEFPCARQLKSCVIALGQKQIVSGHVKSFVEALTSYRRAATRENRLAAARSIMGMTTTYKDFGVREKNSELEDAIYGYVKQALAHLGKGEDTHLTEATCNFMMTQCQVCSGLIGIITDLSTEGKKNKMAVEALANLHWELASIYNYIASVNDMPSRAANDNASEGLKRFVAAFAAEAGDLHCSSALDSAAEAVGKVARSMIFGCDDGLWHAGLERASASLFANCRPSSLKSEIDLVGSKVSAAKAAFQLRGDADLARASAMLEIEGALDRMKITYFEGMAFVMLRGNASAPLKLKRGLKTLFAGLPEQLVAHVPKTLLAEAQDKAGLKK